MLGFVENEESDLTEGMERMDETECMETLDLFGNV